jgi:tRNA (mo5U34)-methyltransferase
MHESRSTPTLAGRVAELEWWHTINLGGGLVTPGKGRSEKRLAMIRLPDRLDGLEVLDIGAWDGFFSFECERRGARRVVAMDSSEHGVWGLGTGRQAFDLARETLGSTVEPHDGDVMALVPESVGEFDLVLMLGVLYHLEDPVAALRRVRSVTRRTLIVETHADMLSKHYPAAAFYPVDLYGDPSNWWGPNQAALHGMLSAAGFARVERVYVSPLWERAARALLRGPAELRRGRIVMHAHVFA